MKIFEAIKKRMVKEPARKSYFFGESYRALGRTIATSWSNNWERIGDEWDEIKYSSADNLYVKICLILFRVAILASVAVFGTLFTAIFSLIHVVGLGIMMTGVYIGFVIAAFVDTMFCLINKISNYCATCERKFSRPVYVCPRCSAKHRRLTPSKYGILTRICRCGERLPTTFFNGRQKLDTLCPYEDCGKPVKKGMHTNLLIPVIGGASSGKTCFINMAIAEIDKIAPKYNLDFEYEVETDDDYEENIKHMKKGLLPKKTDDLRLKPYNFYLTPEGKKVKNRITVCDIAGEIFMKQSLMDEQRGYRFADALVVTVDPLSIDSFRAKASETMDIAPYSGSTQSMNDVLSGIINTLESLLHQKATERVNVQLVVIFTKGDIPLVDEQIGEKALKEYLNNNEVTPNEARNALGERFLIDYDEINFVNTLKGKFKGVQYFCTSALGHTPSGKAFVAHNVAEPLLWIIEKSYPSIDLSEYWKDLAECGGEA